MRIRQEISNHISIAIKYCIGLCAYLLYKLSIIHHARIRIGYTMGTEGLAIYPPEGGARRWVNR